jgi:hypothetical protein
VNQPKYKHPLYATWYAMNYRCHNPESYQYKDYGGRGITVCDRWRNDLNAFAEDMGERPKGLSIDRIDNDKGYFPENCRWATWKQQGNNKRSSLEVRRRKGEELNSIRLVIPLNPKVKKKFKRMAEKQKTTMSGLVRVLLARECARLPESSK